MVTIHTLHSNTNCEYITHLQYKDTTNDVHIWNDMNEPSVFSGPEVSVRFEKTDWFVFLRWQCTKMLCTQEDSSTAKCTTCTDSIRWEGSIRVPLDLESFFIPTFTCNFHSKIRTEYSWFWILFVFPVDKICECDQENWKKVKWVLNVMCW